MEVDQTLVDSHLPAVEGVGAWLYLGALILRIGLWVLFSSCYNKEALEHSGFRMPKAQVLTHVFAFVAGLLC